MPTRPASGRMLEARVARQFEKDPADWTVSSAGQGSWLALCARMLPQSLDAFMPCHVVLPT